ncbi:MAG: hypothetical protein QNJ65_21245 [Xenococcaceae cyanobacterium MO_234.B1]|nr:hypothetical protein [Xenococcaceae cyanobacterium MO_234.B1]
MKNQESCLDVKKFLEWRVQLYNALDSRRETVIELLDALSSNQQAATDCRIVS